MSAMAFFSDDRSVCSSSTDSARSSDMPAALIVANWREKMDRSLSRVRPDRPGMVMSRWSVDALASRMDSGMMPCCLSCWAAVASLLASTLPLMRLPLAPMVS
jgi:hypothetical protein